MNTQNMAYGDAPGFVRKAWYTGRQVGATFLRPDHLRTINDTRGIVNYDLAVGDILQFDPYSPQPGQRQPANALATTQAGLNATLGLGPCVGAPNIGTAYRTNGAAAAMTAFPDEWVPTPTDGTNGLVLQPRLCVVTHVHPDVNRRSDLLNANASLARQVDGGWVDVCFLGYCQARFIKNTDILTPAGTALSLFQPLTGASVGGLYTYGGSGATGKPALHNLLAADMDAAVTAFGNTDIGRVVEHLARIHARLAESVETAANGGLGDQAVDTKLVCLGGGHFGI